MPLGAITALLIGLAAVVPGEPAQADRGGVSISAEVTGETGGLPSVGPGVDGGLDLVLSGPYRIGAHLSYRFSQRATAEARSDVGGDFQLLTAAARAAWLPIGSPSGFQLGPTVALELGDLAALGVGVGEARESEHELWLAFGVGVLVTRSLSGALALVAGAELSAPVLRPRFLVVIQGSSSELYRPGLLSARIRLGLELDVL